MLSALTKRSLYKNTVFIFIAVLFFSCQKDLSLEDGGTIVTLPDLSTKTNSSVSGFVTDENDAAVMGATVLFGSSTITTDKYGYFEAKNVQVVKEAAVVIVNKSGYFKGIKTYEAKEGKAAFFRIKLIPKIIVGTVNAASGGTVTLPNGLSIKLNAGTIVNATTNAQYSGSVNVAAFWINPEAADLNKIMPGDLRGIDKDGALRLLKTFGMTAVELTGSSGELLQIVNGQKATLTLSIPSSLTASAPASIPLWYFDETNGLWKQEGSATKAGNTYVGDVGHFSYWNCDYPFPDPVHFDCTIVDANNNPMEWLQVSINYASGASTGCHGYTDSTGYANGNIPGNSQLVLAVYSNLSACSGTPIYTQAFSTTNSNISLGTITIPANAISTISGTLLNCNAQPVTNGYLMMKIYNQFTRYYVYNATGTFNFNSPICGTLNNVDFIGGDLTALQEGPVLNVTLHQGVNNLGTVVACGTGLSEFINYSLNGTPYSILPPPTGQIQQGFDSSATNSMTIYGWSVINATMGISTVGIAQGSNQALNYFNTSQTGLTTITTPIIVHITEYGSIGQFITGNFTGTVTKTDPPNTSYPVTCNFRVRRNF